MFTIRVETYFWASHQLVLPDGTKEPLHQHNWAVTAEVGSSKLNSMGLIMDFHRLKALVHNIVSGLDDTAMEKIDYFQANSSSAENLARYIYERLEPRLPKGVKLQAITVGEEQGSSAKFSKDG
ncbi:MAG: 6-pyruvoyl trahydropterin synthase family protein [Planctomycetota bacterium]